MIQDFFIPVSDEFLTDDFKQKDSIGSRLEQYTKDSGFPDLKDVRIALFDVREGRGNVLNLDTAIGADEVRRDFYKLFYGNWSVCIADLGSVLAGEIIKDTYYAVKKIVSYLCKKNIIPVIIGGSIDLVYANYRAYDELDQTVNLSVASPRFGFGELENELSAQSYLSKIILEEPNNLFNYSNIGYQTYYNSQEEISLMDSLSFEAYRLGSLKDVSVAEPMMRDADIVAIDLGVVKAQDAPANGNVNPNGLEGDVACALGRYAGISDKVTSFGIYEFNKYYDINNRTSKLVSQLIWYFVEGVSLRTNDYPYGSKKNYLKYIVPFEGKNIIFYQSDKSSRWWMQVEFLVEDKYNRHVLIPCSYEDYLNAIAQKLPERWYNVNKKLT
ncbi:formimidoylglutamase [Wenyingzhuangia sp. IMCC45533]